MQSPSSKFHVAVAAVITAHTRAEQSWAAPQSGPVLGLAAWHTFDEKMQMQRAVGLGVGGHSQKLKIDVIKTPKQTQTETSNLPRQFQLESNLISSCSSSSVAAWWCQAWPGQARVKVISLDLAKRISLVMQSHATSPSPAPCPAPRGSRPDKITMARERKMAKGKRQRF